MDNTKKWYESKGVWANLLGFAVMMASMFGLVDAEQGKIVVEQGAEMIVALIVALLNLFGLYGRVVAKDTIGMSDTISENNKNKPLG